jgi:hypothetical protein
MNRLIGYTFFAFFLLFVVYVTLAVMPADILPSIDRERLISGNLSTIASQAWGFVRPLLQLAFIILIFEYVFSKYGEKLKLPALASNGDVKALLAILVVGAFCVAALAGSQYSSDLKDAALVIIGFYFGGVVASRQSNPS